MVAHTHTHSLLTPFPPHTRAQLEEELKQFWYPVEFTAKLTEGMMVPIELFGEQWVVFRGADGEAACLRDECAHRACPLSLGTVEDGRITCAYHGWQFEGDGSCAHMPSTPQCKGVGVTALQVRDFCPFVSERFCVAAFFCARGVALCSLGACVT